MDNYNFKNVEEIAKFLLKFTTIRPTIGIICGTGLGTISDHISDQDVIPYDKIPNFPTSTVAGHAGQMIFGKISGVEVMCMKGRLHFYEGYPTWLVAMPVRVMKLCGVKNLIVSNAAGGLNQSYKVGDVMIIKDHVSFPGMVGLGPTVGPNDEKFGPRFHAMNIAYRRDLVSKARQFWNPKNNSQLREGVYAAMGGPHFETIAEMKLLNILGVDAAGMSTAHEVCVAVHCGIQCFGFSLITNICKMDYHDKKETTHEEHVAVGKLSQDDIASFVIKVVEYIDANPMQDDA